MESFTDNEFQHVPNISYSKLLDPVSDIISVMESLLTGSFGPTTGDQRECFKRIHAYSWGLHTLVMDVITALGLENAATRPAVLERFNALNHPTKATLDNLASGFDGDLNAEQSEVIDFVIDSVASIERMISNLWQYSLLKHDMLQFDIQEFDGMVLFHKLQTTLRASRAPKLRRSFRVLGDEAHLKYAFGEIAHNVRLHAGVERLSLNAQDYGYRVDITIYDKGAGFAARHSEDVFLPFWQSDPANRGLGLGLYLAHEFITGSGGKIALSSERGRGTLVKVSLNTEP